MPPNFERLTGTMLHSFPDKLIRNRRRPSPAWCALALLFAAATSAEVRIVVNGVDDALRSNILNHNDVFRFADSTALSDHGLDDITQQSIDNARAALRPYGYYDPEVRGRYYREADGEPVIELTVKPGAPVVIRRMAVDIEGLGASVRELKRWRSAWPLAVGDRLDQVAWERQKELGLEIANAAGYLDATYRVRRLALDLPARSAEADLVMETGRRYVVGRIEFSDHVLQPGVVEYIPRFEPGDPYTVQLMDDFRLDLWRTGYFTEVNVIESRHPDRDPPAVDLRVELETETRNTYTGALGYGTDTGIRLQANWTKQPMSLRGDRIDVGAGWQEVNREFAVRGAYRLPIANRAREYWVVDAKISFENQDLELKRTDEDENFLTIANGDVDERHVKGGWLKVLNAESGEKQTFVKPFVQYLNSERSYSLIDPEQFSDGGEPDPEIENLLRGIDNAFSVGVDFDIVAIVGQAFETRGYHDRAWIFASDSAIGSEVDFLQVYLSTRRSYLRGQRWKYLLRAEVGYTDADVHTVNVDVDGIPIELSVTELPNFYRFKAGGSASVRGYDFEQLSNNNVGSNNIVTASAEVEYRLTNKWSAAVFADIGNAFNDWSEVDLKLGVGVGIRWYSIAGPIRLDIAQARDFTDRPWRIHVTIGTPLL